MIVVAGCGGEPASEPGAGTHATTGAITIDEALRRGDAEHVLVQGSIVATDDAVRLCSALAESYPPQCGRPVLRVENLDLSAVDGLTTAQGVTWSDREVAVAGRLADGVLQVR